MRGRKKGWKGEEKHQTVPIYAKSEEVSSGIYVQKTHDGVRITSVHHSEENAPQTSNQSPTTGESRKTQVTQAPELDEPGQVSTL